MPMPRTRQLILASTSVYRRELLQRLRLPFQSESPEVDETPLAGEVPGPLARRLALAKARAVATRFPGANVIGSDQVADLQDVPLGKPGNHARAVAQLQKMRGQTIIFHTAVAVVCLESGYCAEAMAEVQAFLNAISSVIALAPFIRAEATICPARSTATSAMGMPIAPAAATPAAIAVCAASSARLAWDTAIGWSAGISIPLSTRSIRHLRNTAGAGQAGLFYAAVGQRIG